MHRSVHSAQPECALHQRISRRCSQPAADHIAVLQDMYFDPALVPRQADDPRFRNEGGERRRSEVLLQPLSRKARRREHQGPHRSDQQVAVLQRHLRPRHPVPRCEISPGGGQQGLTLDVRDRDSNRSAIQQTVMQCMATLDLDAVTYPTGNVPAGPHQGAGRAGRQRPVASGLDIARTDGLPGDHRPGRVHDPGLRSRSRLGCSRRHAPGRPGTGKDSRGDRFSGHAIWRTDAVPDRLGVRKSDTSSDFAPRIWPVGRKEMTG